MFLLISLHLSVVRLEAASLASKTLVIYNSADPESAELANYYAARRGIPDRLVVGLRCPLQEEITRAQYDEYVAGPLRDKFIEENWWKGGGLAPESGPIIENKIRFVALMRGMPLKIQAEAGYPGDKVDAGTPYGSRNEASVDSELAVLALRSPQISGPLNNPYYQEYGRFDAVELPQLMLVCRLDGPVADDVKRMIDDSIRAEQTGLWGWVCLDARGTILPGYKMGDDWIFESAGKLGSQGFPIFLDRTEAILPTGLPLPLTAFYFGWYGENFSGALAGADHRFAKGAVACHIHSFSASTLHSQSIGWCGPLISNGAAAVMGNVYEPYLALTADLGTFTDRLLRGFTFAESAWASLRTTSWVNVNIGDPLYRPCAMLAEGRDRDHGAMEEFAKSTRSGLVDSSSGFLAEAWAQRKLYEGDEEAAQVLFQEALQKYREPDALARVTWSYGQMLIARGQKWKTVEMVRKMQQRVKGGSSSAFLLTWLVELEPPPASPPASRAASSR